MKEQYKALVDKYIEERNLPFELQDYEGELYADSVPVTFTDEPLKDVLLKQSIMVTDEDIQTSCSYYTEIENMDLFETLAELFMDKYGVTVRYDADYSAIKVDLCADQEEIAEAEDKDELLEFILNCSVLLCRMMVYTYYFAYEEGLEAQEAFEEVSENDGDILIAEEITYNTKSDSLITEGKERYFIEHTFLPGVFYDNPKAFIERVIEEQSEYIDSIVEDALMENEAMQIPDYNKFTYKKLIDEEKCKCISIGLPNAEKFLECSDIILFWSEEKESRYFTVEVYFSEDKECQENKIYYACAWDEEGNHYNYGEPGTNDEAVKIITDMIKN